MPELKNREKPSGRGIRLPGKATMGILIIAASLILVSNSIDPDAARMQAALNEKLWSDGQGYLINYYEDGSPDTHYYIGSLTASHYDLLDADRKEKLAATATRKIVDPHIGVYTVWPMDFHTLTDYLKLNGNEAGYEEAARVMTVEVAGFPGHQVKAVIESPYPAENVILNGAQAIEWTSVKYLDIHQIEIEFIQNRATDEIAIVFTGE